MKKCKEAIQNRSPRERILSVLGGACLSFLPEIGSAETSAMTIQACDIRGNGYLEQTEGPLGFRTIQHLVHYFRTELQNGCNTLEIAQASMDLSTFVNAASCETYPDFPANLPAALNDPSCLVSLPVDLATDLEEQFTPLERIRGEFTIGETLEMVNAEGDMVTFRIRQIFPEFLTLEITDGIACVGDSGTPINLGDGTQSVGEFSAIYGPNKFVVDEQNCVGSNAGHRTGGIMNRPTGEID